MHVQYSIYTISSYHRAAGRQLLFCLYDKQGKFKSNDLNEMRAKMCKDKEKGNSEIATFPSCEAAFKQKVRRAMLQSQILSGTCIYLTFLYHCMETQNNFREMIRCFVQFILKVSLQQNY